MFFRSFFYRSIVYDVTLFVSFFFIYKEKKSSKLRDYKKTIRDSRLSVYRFLSGNLRFYPENI